MFSLQEEKKGNNNGSKITPKMFFWIINKPSILLHPILYVFTRLDIFFYEIFLYYSY